MPTSFDKLGEDAPLDDGAGPASVGGTALAADGPVAFDADASGEESAGSGAAPVGFGSCGVLIAPSS
ncbi:hypothetical protein [Nocardia brasiliensis]|uniref:hypothetical protein n=1 Tax=Nocardia brasiliensis TaxID=37326 RepID=UPI002456A9AD|nr:hypothetical protein [Nocardia brasiliensis]